MSPMRYLALPPALTGLWALLRILPKVNRQKALLGFAGIILASALPVAVTIATGLLIGAIPAAVRGGLDSTDGRAMLTLLTVAATVVLLERIVAPVLRTLAGTLGRSMAQRAKGQRTIARGAGMLSGAWGFVYAEYKRS